MSACRISMTMNIHIAAPADEAAIIQCLTLAFSTDPAVRWTWPDPHVFMTHFPRFVKAFGGHAFAHGTAYSVAGHQGAALWLPPNGESDDEVIENILRESLSPAMHGEVMAVLAQMGSHHPAEPHWYLPLIGVDPFHQGQGHGAALMKHAMRVCDEAGQAAYLESTNPQSIGLYERHGFEVRGRIQLGSSPPIFPMLRPAR